MEVCIALGCRFSAQWLSALFIHFHREGLQGLSARALGTRYSTIIIRCYNWGEPRTCWCLRSARVRVGVSTSGNELIAWVRDSLPQRVLWERGYNVYRNAYAGNEFPNWSADVTVDMVSHRHSYRRASKARQSTLEQAKTVLSTSRTLSQASKVRLRPLYRLGTANRNFQWSTC